MGLESLFPFGGNHAIQSAAFALEWQLSLTQEELSKLQQLHARFKQTLPAMAMSPIVQFQLGPGALQKPQISESSLGAVSFSRPNKSLPFGAPAVLLEISLNRCIIQFNEYARWRPALDEVMGLLQSIIPEISQARSIKDVGLQYTDIFNWRARPDLLELGQVFRRENQFLPSNVFATKELWHSSHGYFEAMLNPVEGRMLDNVNVNLTEQDGQRSIVIVTVHKYSVTSGLWASDHPCEKIRSIFEFEHARNKSILGSMLTQEVRDMINLKGG